ncbi:MAG: hypothetical protein A4E52_01284 [Pelotomaculum sp. PtaB.Bin013]|nr:MAG: hypothetical protein A4E52_01284 [Pelotomaculum sp. PtaB.Bin013]
MFKMLAIILIGGLFIIFLLLFVGLFFGMSKIRKKGKPLGLLFSILKNRRRW